MAEVGKNGMLDVEIGDLIYGPKKTNQREGGKRQKVRAVAALATAGVLFTAIGILMPLAQEYGRHFVTTPTYLLQYVLRPFALALLGWGIAEAGRAFADICIWKNRQRRTIRMIRICYYVSAVILAVSAVLALWSAADLTYQWWQTSRMRRLRVNFDFSTIPSLIPSWLQVIYFRMFVQFRLSSVWVFLGAALGFCRIDRHDNLKTVK